MLNLSLYKKYNSANIKKVYKLFDIAVVYLLLYYINYISANVFMCFQKKFII